MGLRLKIALMLTIVAALACFTAVFAEMQSAVPDEIRNELAWQAMERVKAEVLAVQKDPNSSATEITVGFRIEDSRDAGLVNLKKIQFAERNKGKITDLNVDSFWHSQEGQFAIVLLQVGATVKPSALTYNLFSNDGAISYQGKLRNEIFGFSDYKAISAAETGSSLIFELNGCHYITVARWCSDTGIREIDGGAAIITDASSYALVPLERGLDSRSLDDAVCWVINSSEELTENIYMTVSILEDEQGRDGRVEVQLKAELFVPEQVYESNAFDETIFHLINQEAIRSSEVVLTDSVGRSAVLEY